MAAMEGLAAKLASPWGSVKKLVTATRREMVMGTQAALLTTRNLVKFEWRPANWRLSMGLETPPRRHAVARLVKDSAPRR